MATYDKYYEKHDYFGNPYPKLIKFFSQAKKGTLLDLGAGQGRDSVALSSMGYEVTSVDISKIGIDQIKKADPTISAFVANLYEFNVSGYSYILLDSILHFYQKDKKKEVVFLRHVLNQMDTGSILVNCLLKNQNAEVLLKNVVKEFDISINHEEYIEYPEFKSIYHFLVIEKK